MTLLNRKMDYALLILCYLHHRPGGGCAREIAAHFQLSRPFLANILKDLARRGFVVSQRGVKGGYVLRAATSQLTLLDLMESFSEDMSLTQCTRPATEPADCCSLSSCCPIRAPIARVNQRLRAVLQTVTLAELFAEGAPPLPLDVSRCGADQTPAAST